MIEFHVQIFDGGRGWGGGVKEWARDTKPGRQTLADWLQNLAGRPGFQIISITQTDTILTAIVQVTYDK